MNNSSLHLPNEAEIIACTQESPTIFTLTLRFTDSNLQRNFSYQPGQFNMVYLYGVGEVAISISSDADNKDFYTHTIRSVGRVTKGLEKLSIGDRVGIRGPYGRGWPLEEAKNKDIIIVTGGLGCAPVVAMINYIMQRRDQFGAIKILQGVKHSNDFIFQQRYAEWKKFPQTEVLISADKTAAGWPWYIGRITDLIQQLTLNPVNSIAMMCGPEKMLEIAANELLKKKIAEQQIYLNLERNMECAVGHCGHCQFGGFFLCKNGPVFAFSEIKKLLGIDGF